MLGPARVLSSVVVAVLGVVVSCANGCANGSSDGAGAGDDGTSSGGPGVDGGGLPATDAAGGPGSDASADDAAAGDAASDACTTALATASFDFDSGDQGFTHGTSDGVAPPPAWPYDPWTRGTASVGTACKSGSCWGAELGQNYAQCQRGYLVSPAIDLGACKGRAIAVAFDHAYSFWTGSYGGSTWYDGGVVEVSGDGTTWQPATGATAGTVAINPNRGASYACVQPNGFGVDGEAGFVGASLTTAHVELAIPASAITSATRVRFSVASGVSSSTTDPDASRAATSFGWRIDDVAFVAK